MYKNIKYELRNIIEGNGFEGEKSLIKTIQSFLRGNEKTSREIGKEKFSKKQEEIGLLKFIDDNKLWYIPAIRQDYFIAEGAEQKVYRLNDKRVLKLNDSIFYEKWIDYMNGLLIHNYFFTTTAYELLGFKMINNKLFAVVSQPYILTNEIVKLENVKSILIHNGFENIRNNDYFNSDLGLILEDLHDENVLVKNDIFYFIDTIFYLTENFYN